MAQSDIELVIGADVTGLRNALRDAERGVRTFSERNRAMMNSVGDLAAPFAAAFAGLALGVGVAVKSFAEFESALKQVQAVSGATAKEMEAVKSAALELGAKTKFSAKEAANGIAELTKAGMTAQQALKAIPGVMSLAAAGGVSVAEAAETASNTLNGFGLAADQAGKVADVLAKAANVSAIGVNDLAESMKYVAPVAASSSQSLEEVATNLAILGNVGIKGSQGGTIIRAALAALVKPSEDAATRLNALGISVQDTTGKMLPLSQIVDQLRTNTAKLTETQRNSAIATIFGTEAMSGILALMKQTPAATAAVANQFKAVAGTADEMAAVMNGGLKPALEQMNGSLETAGALLGEQFAPSIMAVAGSVQAAADGFSKLPSIAKTMIVALVAAGAAFTALGVAAAGFAAAAPVVLAGITALGLAAGPVVIGITALSLALGGVTAAAKLQADAIAESAKKLAEERRERQESISKGLAYKDALSEIVKRHDELADKAKRSKEEERELKELFEKLKAISPELATQLAELGNQHWANAQALDAHNKKLAENINLQRQALKAEVMSASIALRRKATQTDTEEGVNRARRAVLTGNNPVPGIPTKEELREAIKQTTSILEDSPEAKRLREAQQALLDFNRMIATGGKVTTTPIARGAIVSAPAKKPKATGKSEAQRNAEEEAKAAEDIATAYREAAADKVIAMQNANGLILQESERLSQAELEEIAAVTRETEVFYQERAANVANANNLVVQEGFALAEALDNQFKDSIRDMQGELLALATDPSLERIANFAKGLAQDEDKLKKWSDAIGNIGESFKKAGGGVKGLESALLSMGSAVDPVSLAITGVVNLAFLMKDAFDEANRAQERLRESAAETAREIRKFRAEASGDAKVIAEATRDSARESLNERLLAEMKQRKEDLKSDPTFSLRDFMMNGALSKQVDEMTLDDFPQLKELQEVTLASIDETFRATVESIDKAAGLSVSSAKETSDGVKDAFEDMAREAEKAAEQILRVNGELEAGGRDSYGNRISVEDEAALKVASAEAEYAEKRRQADAKIRDIRADILAIAKEEAELVADIENEGLATRAKSEFQDKTERIAKIRQESQEKRDAKTQEMNDLEAQMVKEREATDRTVSNIKILASERVTALKAERDALQALITKANEAAAAYRRMRSEAGGSSSSSSSSNNTTGAAYGDTSGARYDSSGRKVAYTKNGVNYYHGGGTHLGPGEKASVIKNNEFVFTPEQFNGLVAMRQAATRSTGGSNVYNITVNGANKSNRQIVDDIKRELGAPARRAGY